MDKRNCPECKKDFENCDFVWVKDRYGIPYRKVCWDCSEAVQSYIDGWEFDPGDAGEALEPEHY